MNLDLLPDVILKEKWDWVDRYLEERYYGYALTCENYDDYLAAGMMAEKWGWMDYDLENQYNKEDEMRILCPAPNTWVCYKENITQLSLENEGRSRAESDISDHSDEVERVINNLTYKPSPVIEKYFAKYNYSESDADEFYDCDGYDSY